MISDRSLIERNETSEEATLKKELMGETFHTVKENSNEYKQL
jgi:hypothetical protein